MINKNIEKVNDLLSSNKNQLAYKILIKEELLSPKEAILYIVEFFLDRNYDYSCFGNAPILKIGNIMIDYIPGGHDGYGGNTDHEIDFYLGEQRLDGISVETSFPNNWEDDKKEILKMIKTILPQILSHI